MEKSSEVNHPQDNNSEWMVDDNQERGSVSGTSDPSEENSTTLNPSLRTTSYIASEFLPANNARGTQNQRNLTNLFPQKNIILKKKTVQEVH